VTVSLPSAIPLSPSLLPEFPFNAPMSSEASSMSIASSFTWVIVLFFTVGTPSGEDTVIPAPLEWVTELLVIDVWASEACTA